MQALRQVDILKKQLDELLPMKEEYKRELDKKIRLEFNYNSNHMEGNTFTYGETKLLLLFGQTSAGKTIRDTEEMKAHDVAYKMITDWAADKDYVLTERDIKNLNRIILVEPFKKAAQTPDGQPTSRIINIGDYKQQSNSVETATGEIFEFASPMETPIKMGDLMQWYRDEEANGEFDAVTLAALFHYRFVRIHPFDDGNGRISRLLMNYILLRKGYPPVIVKSADKHNYFAALRSADADDIEAFIQYIAGQLQWSLGLYIKAAKGESIDEPGDFEKKLEQLKRRIGKGDSKIEKGPEVLRKCLSESVFPLIDIMLKKLNGFDPLFKYKHFSIGYEMKYPNENFYNEVDEYEDFKHWMPHYEFLRTISFKYKFEHFKKKLKTFDSLDIITVVDFSNTDYVVHVLDTDFSLKRFYDEEISILEAEELVDNVGNMVLKRIESTLESN